MPITGNASYLNTLEDFSAHWAQTNVKLAPKVFVVRIEDKDVSVNRAQLDALRLSLLAQQTLVQSRRTAEQIASGALLMQKTALLARLNLFIARMDGYYGNTSFVLARPYAPSLSDGRDNFTRPLGDAMTLWEKMNAGPAPAGVTLPLVLADGTDQGSFASAIAALQFAYAEERTKSQDVTLARGERNQLQDQVYEIMKAYREGLPGSDAAKFPVLIETMPRLTPLPGHTPAPVNSSVTFEAPDAARVVYNASTDAALAGYQLRGNVGGEYDNEDAVVIATHAPGAPREFVTDFGLNQPGARIALGTTEFFNMVLVEGVPAPV